MLSCRIRNAANLLFWPKPIGVYPFLATPQKTKPDQNQQCWCWCIVMENDLYFYYILLGTNIIGIEFFLYKLCRRLDSVSILGFFPQWRCYFRFLFLFIDGRSWYGILMTPNVIRFQGNGALTASPFQYLFYIPTCLGFIKRVDFLSFMVLSRSRVWYNKGRQGV